MGFGRATAWGLLGWVAGSALEPVYGVALVVLVTVLTSMASAVHHKREFTRPQQRRRAR